jgi:hypothetical protein
MQLHLIAMQFHLVARRFYLVAAQFHLVAMRFYLSETQFYLIGRLTAKIRRAALHYSAMSLRRSVLSATWQSHGMRRLLRHTSPGGRCQGSAARNDTICEETASLLAMTWLSLRGARSPRRGNLMARGDCFVPRSDMDTRRLLTALAYGASVGQKPSAPSQ